MSSPVKKGLRTSFLYSTPTSNTPYSPRVWESVPVSPAPEGSNRVGALDLLDPCVLNEPERTRAGKCDDDNLSNTLQHAATHCETLRHSASLCNTLQCDVNWSNPNDDSSLSLSGMDTSIDALDSNLYASGASSVVGTSGCFALCSPRLFRGFIKKRGLGSTVEHGGGATMDIPVVQGHTPTRADATATATVGLAGMPQHLLPIPQPSLPIERFDSTIFFTGTTCTAVGQIGAGERGGVQSVHANAHVQNDMSVTTSNSPPHIEMLPFEIPLLPRRLQPIPRPSKGHKLFSVYI